MPATLRIAAEFTPWGATLWRLGADGTILDTRRMPGASVPAFAGAAEAVISGAGDWRGENSDVIAMVCGLSDVALSSVPCGPLGSGFQTLELPEARLTLLALPALAQTRPAGLIAEGGLRVAGFLSARPGFDGVLCMAGPHSHWLHLSADEIVSFRSFMSGEIAGLLARDSALMGCLEKENIGSPAFSEAVSDSMSRPETLAASLLSLSAEHRLTGLSPQDAGARLTGLLTGAELAATRPYWLGQQVVVLGAPEHTERYHAALTAQGVPVEVFGEKDALEPGVNLVLAQL